jgi:hypothetical protein
MFKPEELSPALTPERQAARQRVNDDEREMLEAMERELGRRRCQTKRPAASRRGSFSP